jgi:hypothetical protein
VRASNVIFTMMEQVGAGSNMGRAMSYKYIRHYNHAILATKWNSFHLIQKNSDAFLNYEPLEVFFQFHHQAYVTEAIALWY